MTEIRKWISMREYQDDYILRCFEATSGNIPATARLLQIGRASVYRCLARNRNHPALSSRTYLRKMSDNESSILGLPNGAK